MRGKALLSFQIRFVHVLCSMLILAWAVSAQADPLQEALDSFGVQQPQVRKPAPNFSLTGLGGEKVSLTDFRGQLVMLHFWATWCIPCRHEMPLLHELEHTLKGKRFRIICINVDRGEREAVQAFMDKVSPEFHTQLDPEGRVRNQYAVRALPTSYLIAPDGKFIGRILGERAWNSSESVELLQHLLITYAGQDSEKIQQKKIQKK